MLESSPLVRQWILRGTLCAGHYGATVRELAQRMGVHEKTIRRELATRRPVGSPVQDAFCRFGRHTSGPKRGFSRQEHSDQLRFQMGAHGVLKQTGNLGK